MISETSPGQSVTWLSLAPSAIVIIGWWVVSRQSDLRERRKDIRELIVALESRLSDILVKWQSYSAIDGNDPQSPILAAKIKAEISVIPQIIKRISLAGLDVSIDQSLILLRQQVTGGDFESKSRKTTDFSEERNVYISLAAMEIIRSVEERYFETYPAPFARLINLDLVFAGMKKLNR